MTTATAVRLQRHQPGPDHGRDLLQVQENVQRAIDQIRAHRVQTIDIAAGAVGAAQIATGAVGSSQLTPALREAFKYKLTSNAAVTGGTDLDFGTKVSDDSGMVSGGVIKPLATGLVRLHVQLQLIARGLGAAFNSGFRGQIYVVDSTGTVVHAARWMFATVPASGSGYEIVCDLDTELRLVSGLAYTVRVAVLDGTNIPYTSLTAAAESLGASPYVTGSHFELMPTPGS